MPPRNLLQVQAGAKSFGTRNLFRDATFAVNEGEHIGVIGPNGAGKTTLFKAIAALALKGRSSDDALDQGTITCAQGLRIGYLPQQDGSNATQDSHTTTVSQLTVAEVAGNGSSLPPWEIRQLGRSLGLSEQDFTRPYHLLSGGYRMRVKLLNLLAQNPDLMLLDEPTNYLDLETLVVLEDFLMGFRGSFLLISHDREFLRRVTDHTLEVEGGEITKFPGNIDDYFEQKTMLREQLEKQALSQDARRKEILDFAARFGAKATKARQVQSRLRQLDKMEAIALKSLPVSASIKIPHDVPASQLGKLALKATKVAVGYGDKTILNDLNFEINHGDKVGVVGLNGAGKSTLLKTIAGALPLKNGQIDLGYQLSIGYYAQHVGESLPPEQTILQALASKAPPDTPDQQVLDLAGSLMFSGDAVNKKIQKLSGGEKARVALGQILLQKVRCLLLDEPTNHLDFYTVEALTQALVAFPGTVIIVSHDQSFIKRIVTKVMEVRRGEVTLWPGNYDDYVWSLRKGVLAERQEIIGSTPNRRSNESAADSPPPHQRAEKNSQPQIDREEKRRRENRLKQLARLLPPAEAKANQLRARSIELNAMVTDGSANREAIEELGNIHAALEAAEIEWLSLLEEEETLNTLVYGKKP